MPMACSQCGAYFERSAGLAYHMQKVHGEEEPVYFEVLCPCGRTVRYHERQVYTTLQTRRSFVVCDSNHTVWLPEETPTPLVDNGNGKEANTISLPSSQGRQTQASQQPGDSSKSQS